MIISLTASDLFVGVVDGFFQDCFLSEIKGRVFHGKIVSGGDEIAVYLGYGIGIDPNLMIENRGGVCPV